MRQLLVEGLRSAKGCCDEHLSKHYPMKNLTIRPLGKIFVLLLFIGQTFAGYAQNDSVSTVHVGFIYPLSTNGRHAADYTNRFSLHAIAGLSKAETGFTLSSGANIVRQDASGFQVTGGANVIGKSARGVQLAAAANVIGSNASGAQIAGFANVVKDTADGALIAAFANISGSGTSAQIAGFSNIVLKDGNGFQVAGFLNKAKEVNSQLAGVVNVATKVKGVQFAGLINIADSSDYPIAIFNFIKNGEKSLSLSIDETATGMLTFRSGGRVLYGIAGVGYNLKSNANPLFAAEAGLGAHVPVAGPFRINLEAVSQTLTDFDDGHYFRNGLRILPAFRLGKGLEIFAGPTVNYVSYDRENDFSFVRKFIWRNDGSKDFQGVFVGFNAGLQYVF
jgi:hypothetical protein